MRERTLQMPELMFVIGTRAALAAGVALLVSGRFSERQRRIIGTVLVGIGAVTTVPAAMMVFGKRSAAPEKIDAE
jgi:cyanate permease